MNRATASKGLFLLCITAFGIMSTLPAKAKQSKFPYKIEVDSTGEAIGVKIGRRKSVNEGNIASLNALAYIIRKYPKATLYGVDWTIKGKKGEIHAVETFFARRESMLRRQSEIILGKSVPLTQLVYHSIPTEYVIEFGERRRNFDALQEFSVNVSDEYWH